MAGRRFTPLESIFAVLFVIGGITVFAADKLGNDTATTAGIILIFAGAIVFGLDMVVQRRAEIGTRYTSHINPDFHVFRGASAVAWGAVFICGGVLFISAAVSSLTIPADAEGFFSRNSGWVVILGGLVITAWGIGSSGVAVRRQGDTEKPAQRRLDRLAAMVLIIPIGLAILGWGVLTTVAPSVAKQAASWAKSAAIQTLGHDR
jgi:hypothetical protein